MFLVFCGGGSPLSYFEGVSSVGLACCWGVGYNGQTERLLEVSCSSMFSGAICYTWCNQVSNQMKSSGPRRYNLKKKKDSGGIVYTLSVFGWVANSGLGFLELNFVEREDLIHQLRFAGTSQLKYCRHKSGGPSWPPATAISGSLAGVIHGVRRSPPACAKSPQRSLLCTIRPYVWIQWHTGQVQLRL